MPANHKLIVIGCGSIGRRHLRNLVALGVKDIFAFDVDKERLLQVKEIDHRIQTFTRLGVLLRERPSAAVIAVPTSLHVSYAVKAAKAGCHLFIEKPLSHHLAGSAELGRMVRAKRLVVFIGYNFRFHPSLLRLKKILSKNFIGKITSGRAHFGSYLPDRHPNQDYRRGYGARRSMGGGVILDSLSHSVDYLSFLMGRPLAVFGYAAKHSRLAIDVEDVAEVLIKFKSGAIVSLHGDWVQRPYKHTLELIGDKGTAACDLFGCLLKIYTSKTHRWAVHRDGKDLNRMYRCEMKHFLACTERRATPSVGLDEGVREMDILMKIKESALKGRWIKI